MAPVTTESAEAVLDRYDETRDNLIPILQEIQGNVKTAIPVEVLRKHLDRICHVHFKDVRKRFDDARGGPRDRALLARVLSGLG